MGFVVVRQDSWIEFEDIDEIRLAVEAHGPRPAARGPRPAAHGPRPTARGPRPTARGPRPADSRGPRPTAPGPRPPRPAPRAPCATCYIVALVILWRRHNG